MAAPIVLTIENKWIDGKTKDEVAAVLKEMSECCMKIDGIMAFQYAIDEENKVNFLTEVYKDAAALGAMMKGTGEMRPKLFEAVKTTKVVCSGPEAAIAPLKETLAKMGTVFYYTDAVGTGFKCPAKGTGAGAPLIMTIENKFNDGKEKADVAPVLTKMTEGCMQVDGIHMFQYAMNDETKTNFLTEVYTGAAGVGAMMAAGKANGNIPALFGAITTTKVSVCGPEATIAPLKETLANMGAKFYYTDAVCPAFEGFGGN